MQKFGLDNSPSKKISSIEAEIMGDQAAALGSAGRNLEEAIKKYRALLGTDESQNTINQHLQEIADAAWALSLQREFIGFIHDNIRRLKEKYEIPEEALKLFGKSKNG